MKNAILFIMLVVSSVFALNDVTKPYNFAPRDTLKASKFNANYDTLYNRINQNNDSVDIGFIRWYDLNSRDSTIKYLKVDTIRSNPNVDSITGNVVITGSPIITGTTTLGAISSSGRITGTDISVSDSVAGTTAVFTNVSISPLTTYYLPYKAASGYLANSPIYTNGTNVAVGKSSVDSWASDRRALQIGGNTAIIASSSEVGNETSVLANNCYYTGVWEPYSTGSAGAFRIGSNGFTWRFNNGLTEDVTFTPTDIASLDSLGRFTALRGSAQDIIASDSIKGATGTFSSTVKVDSLNSTKGITSSGRFAGTDISVSDSVIGSTIMSTNTITAAGSISGYNVSATNNLYGVGGVFTGRITGTDIAVSDSVVGVTGTFSGALASTTLNTGNGANELYAMNQAVRTTDSITALTNRATRGNFDSITFDGTNYLKEYTKGSFPCTLSTTYIVARSVVTATYEVLNKFVRINIPPVYGSSIGTTSFIIINCGGLPESIRPTVSPHSSLLTKVCPVNIGVVNGGSANYGVATINIIGGVLFPVISYSFGSSGIIGTNSNTLFQYYLD